MRKLIGLLIASGLAFASTARADIVNETVALSTGVGSCPGGGAAVKQEFQDPDGGYTWSNSEYEVPAGYVLEITDVDVQHNMQGEYSDWVTVSVRNRLDSTKQYTGFAVELVAQPIMKGDANLNLSWTDSFQVKRGSEHYALNTGFLVRQPARVCVSWKNGVLNNQVHLRGRLHPYGTVVTAPGGVLTTK